MADTEGGACAGQPVRAVLVGGADDGLTVILSGSGVGSIVMPTLPAAGSSADYDEAVYVRTDERDSDGRVRFVLRPDFDPGPPGKVQGPGV